MREVLEKIFGDVKSVREYSEVGVDNPHGIYIYDHERDKWLYIDIGDKPFTPRHDGVYVIYFDNTKCPACRVYDIYWFPYIKLLAPHNNIYYVIILCEWFAGRCRSICASVSFKHYDIHASPTTLLLCIRNGREIDREKHEGVKTMDKLAEIVENFAKKNGFLENT